jgi:peptidoglycan/xylan/chitin deacetylase (PgdA/CDA1 family)
LLVATGESDLALQPEAARTEPTMPPPDRTLILMYHRVGRVAGAAELKYCIAPDRFAAQMHLLAKRGYRAVPIDAFVQWLHGGPPLKAGDFVLTFDDGFLDVREHALPVLAQLGWPFTVFLVTDLLGGVDAWKRNDSRDGGQHPLLSANDVLAMREHGASFHSHTRRHVSLPTLDDAALATELSGSRAALSGLLGDGAYYLAYPYGHLDDRVESAARAVGYKAAFSVQPGFNRKDVNPFRIRRLDVFGTDTPTMLLRKMQLGSNEGSLRTTLGYCWRRMAWHVGGRGS